MERSVRAVRGKHANGGSTGGRHPPRRRELINDDTTSLPNWEHYCFRQTENHAKDFEEAWESFWYIDIWIC